jgi:hypothetical protein
LIERLAEHAVEIVEKGISRMKYRGSEARSRGILGSG